MSLVIQRYMATVGDILSFFLEILNILFPPSLNDWRYTFQLFFLRDKMTVFAMISLMHCYFNYTNWAFMDSAAEKKLKSILNFLLCFHKQLSLLFLLSLFVCFGTKHPISSWVKVNCTASHLNKLYHCRLAYAIEVIHFLVYALTCSPVGPLIVPYVKANILCFFTLS